MIWSLGSLKSGSFKAEKKLPSRKNQQPCYQEDQSKDDKQRVTCSPPFSIVEHLSRLGKEEVTISWQK